MSADVQPEGHHAAGSGAAPRAGRPPGRGAGAHPALLHQGDRLRGPPHHDQARWAAGGRLLPGPLEPRQGRPLHPRGQLHRLVLVEGLRQGRDHHLGDPADRLPLGRPRLPGVRAPRLPARRRLLLVHLLPDPGALPLRPRRAAADVPRGEEAARRGSRRRLGARGGEQAARQGLQVGPGQGRPGPGLVGRGRRDGRRRPRAHDQDLRPRPGRRLLADPGDVDGLARLRGALRQPRRRVDAELLRLVRRPPGGLAAGLRRPDRRPGVGRLVEQRLPDHVGLQPPGHADARRALDDRGALPRAEGRRRGARLRRQRQVRRRLAAGPTRHRRRAGDGHGPRRAAGVLRGEDHGVLRPLREDLHRPAVPGAARGDRRGGRAHRRQVPHGRRPRRAPRRGERGLQDRARRRRHRPARRPQRVARPPLRRERGGAVEPRPRRRRAAPLPARTEGEAAAGRRRAGAVPPLRHPRRAPPATSRGACRRDASAGTSSPRSSTC